MDFWTNIFIFTLVLFFYLHIQHQFKRSEDLEIYEMDYLSNANLQEICAMKQPVLFQLESPITELFSKIHMEMKEEVCVKDVRDYLRVKEDNTTIDAVSLSFSSAYGLMKTDSNHTFFSENNAEFILENGLEKIYAKISDKIAEPWSAIKTYDLLFGSAGVQTPWKYHTYSERFLAVSDGAGIRVKMTPWKSQKYLEVKQDFENYEFWAANRKIPEIKTVDFVVKPGFVVFIPAFWFYTIEIISPVSTDPANTSSISYKTSFIASFSYATPMNVLANLPNYGRYYLQQQNKMKPEVKILSKSKESSRSKSEDVSIPDTLRDLQEPKEKEKDVKIPETISPNIQEMLNVIEKKEIIPGPGPSLSPGISNPV